MIEKRLVQWYAADAGVDLDIAEREIVLTYVLRILADQGLLTQLAFKGGTASRFFPSNRWPCGQNATLIGWASRRPTHTALRLVLYTFVGMCARTSRWNWEDKCTSPRTTFASRRTIITSPIWRWLSWTID